MENFTVRRALAGWSGVASTIWPAIGRYPAALVAAFAGTATLMTDAVLRALKRADRGS